jgi:Yip1-like protein
MQTNGAGSLLGLAVRTLQEPKRNLRIVLDIVITMSELMQATALVVVLSMILPTITMLLQPAEVQDAMAGIHLNPVKAVVVQMAVLIVASTLIAYVGRMFKGFGTFKEALTAMVWLQFVLIGVQIIQLLVGFIVPQLSMLVFMLSLGLMLYLTVNFIMEIHGFTNTSMVIFGVVGSFFAVAMVFSFILVLLGFTPEAFQDV